jgi:hypothetical protein
MAKKKKEEEEEKKTKQKRTRRKVDYIYTGHSRDRDRNAIKQSNEAQFKRNKANFITRRTMFKKSELAKNFDSGRLTSKDLGEVNKIFAESAKNKATMIKNINKKAKKSASVKAEKKKSQRPEFMVKAGRAVKKMLDKQIEDKKNKQNKGIVTGVGRDPKESDKDNGNAKQKRKRPVEKKKTKTKITIKVKPLKNIKVETKKEEKKRKEKEKKSGIKLNNRYGD